MALEKTPLFVADVVNGVPAVIDSFTGYYFTCASKATADYALKGLLDGSLHRLDYGWRRPGSDILTLIIGVEPDRTGTEACS